MTHRLCVPFCVNCTFKKYCREKVKPTLKLNCSVSPRCGGGQGSPKPAFSPPPSPPPNTQAPARVPGPAPAARLLRARSFGAPAGRADTWGSLGPFLFGLRPLGATGRRRNWGGAARSGAEAGGGRGAGMTRQANGAGADPASGRLTPGMAQLLSALFYGTCSFLIVLVNKALLTTYG